MLIILSGPSLNSELAKIVQLCFKSSGKARSEYITQEVSIMVIDPVCKKEIDENTAAGGKARFWGKVFFFCDKKCRGLFQRDPQKYVSKDEKENEPGYDPRMFIGDM